MNEQDIVKDTYNKENEEYREQQLDHFRSTVAALIRELSAHDRAIAEREAEKARIRAEISQLRLNIKDLSKPDGL